MVAPSSGSPRVIGRYAIYDRIASGGMATVHLGRLLGLVGFARTVAIKRLHPHFAEDPQFVSMFLDEARLAARISHPNVVQTLDVVATSDELFLVMEYVQGESLARLIRFAWARKEPIAPAVATTVLAGVLHGLHAAHEARGERGELLGIVHRDVSPQNVMVGIDGVARVLDFGVAKAAGRVQNTQAGQLKGKLAYMAPEQVGGTVARTTDVYAASVVLWETLTGRRLFGGDSDGEVMKRVMEGCSTPPSHFAKSIPPELDALTMRGLAQDPGARPSTAQEMALALEDCLPLVPASRVGKWVQGLASETLGQRTERIAAIESDSAVRIDVRKADGVAPVPLLAGDASDDVIPTQMSSGTVSNPGRAPSLSPASRRGLVWATAVGALVGLVLLGAVAVGMRHHRDVVAASSAPRVPPPGTATAPSPAKPSAIASSTVPPTPTTSAALAAASAVAPGTTSASASVSVAAPAAQRAPASRPPAAHNKAQCDPPYYFDAQGNHHFKPECL